MEKTSIWLKQGLEMFKYYIYKFGQFCVNRLSLRMCYRVASVLSDIQYYFSPRDRQAVKNNLKMICPPGAPIPRLAKEVFRNFGKYLVEFFRMVKEINPDFIRERVKVRDLDNLKTALSKKKGAIIMTAHIGNWELGAVLCSMLGYPPIAVALPHKERPVNNLFNKQREILGVKVVPTYQAMRRCLKSLRDNQPIAVVADRDFNARGEVLDFLDRKAIIPRGAAILSLKTGAPIVPTFLIRQDDDTFKLFIEEPIWPSAEFPDRVEKETLLELMRTHTAVIEKKIRQFPSQWLMFREYGVNHMEHKSA